VTPPSTHPFTGLLAYPITPVAGDAPDDMPDFDALSALVTRIATDGADAVVVLASSGAGTSFRDRERAEIVRAATGAASGLPVHVGISAATAWQVVDNARAAERAGASGLVLAPFSYTPLTDDEVVALYGAVAAATGLPVCFYNKPLQTGYDLTADVLERLVAHGVVAGVKDSDREDGDGEDRNEAAAAREWLLELAGVLATLRPVSGLHALATLLGTPTGPPRLPSLPVAEAGVTALRAVVERRP
jgi:4-hydroxy-tetrahydrodipicolinate synthase